MQEQGHIFYRNISLRVSDGEFYHDYTLSIEWVPNPYGGGEVYMPFETPLTLEPAGLSDALHAIGASSSPSEQWLPPSWAAFSPAEDLSAYYPL
jgi:hypothetical protein